MATEYPPDYLVVSRRGLDGEGLLALGQSASKKGYAVHYAIRDDTTDGALPLPSEFVPPPVYATLVDFRRIGREHGKGDPESSKAWSLLRKDFIWAHHVGGVALVKFNTHPPIDEQWGPRAEVGDLDVYSLERLVQRVMKEVKGKGASTVNHKLSGLLPPSIGIKTVEFWKAVTEDMLPPQPTQES
ncbi:MAG TPA: hypothetical protein VLE73_02360 [Candidatus Saccharimonadales bacterium]|nr:hypothetical protein [Candidatus Saccharimonadales bacterium]